MKIVKIIIKIIVGIVLAFVGLVVAVMVMDSKPSSSSSSSSSTTTIDYIDVVTYDEKKLQNESEEFKYLSLNPYTMLSFLEETKPDMSYASYFEVAQALQLRHASSYSKNEDTSLLKNGKLDVDLLVRCVQQNNEDYMNGTNAINMFYKEMDISHIRMICTLICEVVNEELYGIRISEASDTLLDLKMFERTGSASNAYVTDDLVFIYNPTMVGLYADMQEIAGTSDSEAQTQRSVIVHEIMHLLQYAKSDRNDYNGLEAGICWMFNLPNEQPKLAVDSLWSPWILEASAELGMADYLDVVTGTYQKKISYLNSLNLCFFEDFTNLTFRNEPIGDVQEFYELLYAIELTQSSPEDFWKHLGKEEDVHIRMEIRDEAICQMTYIYYTRLMKQVASHKITDVDTLFMMMRLWELDAFSHLEYSTEENLAYAKKYVTYHYEVQSKLLELMGESFENYNNYCLYVDGELHGNINLDVEDILSRLKSTRFSRVNDVYAYIKSERN